MKACFSKETRSEAAPGLLSDSDRPRVRVRVSLGLEMCKVKVELWSKGSELRVRARRVQ